MDFVKIGGKKRPVHFGFNALRLYCDATGRTLSRLGDEMTLDDTVELIHAGLTDGARVAKEQYDADKVTLCDWLDADPELYSKILELYGSSLGKLFPPTRAGATA